MKILWAADAQLDHGRIYFKQDINVFLLVKNNKLFYIQGALY
jgi:hypothetical protein